MKKIIVILILLVSALFITACTETAVKNTVSSADQSKTAQINEPSSANNANTVLKLTDLDYATQQAISKKTAECDKIVRDELKNICLSELILMKAIDLNDIKLCDNLDETYKYGCYYNVSIKSKDFALCRKIPLSKIDRQSLQWITTEKELLDVEFKRQLNVLRALCEQTIVVEIRDPNMCNKISSGEDYLLKDYKDNCFMQIAIETQDIDLCQSTLDPIMCSQKAGYKKGQITKNASKCNDFSNIDAKNNCFLAVGTETNSLSSCDKITIITMHDECYSAVAFNTKDLNVCNMILGESSYGTAKDRCFEQSQGEAMLNAIQNHDSTFCNISARGGKPYSRCFLWFAVINKDKLLCDSIDDSLKYECIQQVAAVKKDNTLCKTLEISSYKSACYELVARVSGNEDVCKYSDSPDCENTVNNDIKMRTQCQTKYQTEEEIDMCITKQAIGQGQSQYCLAIKDDLDRANCMCNNEHFGNMVKTCFKDAILTMKDCETIYPEGTSLGYCYDRTTK